MDVLLVGGAGGLGSAVGELSCAAWVYEFFHAT